MPKEKEEWRKQCAFTKKQVKRAKRYYRNGKYYQNKNAWRAFRKSEKEAQAGESAEATA